MVMGMVNGRGKLHAAVVIVDGVGLTSCVVLFDNRVVRRNLNVHGLVISREAPIYPNKVAVLNSIRTLYGWMRATRTDHGGLFITSKAVILAGILK